MNKVDPVVAIAVLFSMIVGGIIWVTTSQFAGVVAEQKAFNSTVAKSLDRHEAQIESLNGWRATVAPSVARSVR